MLLRFIFTFCFLIQLFAADFKLEREIGHECFVQRLLHRDQKISLTAAEMQSIRQHYYDLNHLDGVSLQRAYAFKKLWSQIQNAPAPLRFEKSYVYKLRSLVKFVGWSLSAQDAMNYTDATYDTIASLVHFVVDHQNAKNDLKVAWSRLKRLDLEFRMGEISPGVDHAIDAYNSADPDSNERTRMWEKLHNLAQGPKVRFIEQAQLISVCGYSPRGNRKEDLLLAKNLMDQYFGLVPQHRVRFDEHGRHRARGVKRRNQAGAAALQAAGNPENVLRRSSAVPQANENEERERAQNTQNAIVTELRSLGALTPENAAGGEDVEPVAFAPPSPVADDEDAPPAPAALPPQPQRRRLGWGEALPARVFALAMPAVVPARDASETESESDGGEDAVLEAVAAPAVIPAPPAPAALPPQPQRRRLGWGDALQVGVFAAAAPPAAEPTKDISETESESDEDEDMDNGHIPGVKNPRAGAAVGALVRDPFTDSEEESEDDDDASDSDEFSLRGGAGGAAAGAPVRAPLSDSDEEESDDDDAEPAPRAERLSAAQKKQIDLLLRGRVRVISDDCHNIAAQVNSSYRQVFRYIYDHHPNIQRPISTRLIYGTQKNQYTEATKFLEARKRNENQLTYAQIAEKVGLTYKQICHFVSERRPDLLTEKAARLTDEQKRQIEVMLTTDITTSHKEIAKRIGCASTQVSKYVDAHARHLKKRQLNGYTRRSQEEIDASDRVILDVISRNPKLKAPDICAQLQISERAFAAFFNRYPDVRLQNPQRQANAARYLQKWQQPGKN